MPSPPCSLTRLRFCALTPPPPYQVEFVGYINNPHFVRGQSYAAASAAVAPLRNTRLDLRDEGGAAQDPQAVKAERAKKRAAAGVCVCVGGGGTGPTGGPGREGQEACSYRWVWVWGA